MQLVLFTPITTESLASVTSRVTAGLMKGLQQLLPLLCSLLVYVWRIEASPQVGSDSTNLDSQYDYATSTSSSSTIALTTSTSSTASSTSTVVSGGASNFAGSNLYYAAGLSVEQRKTYLTWAMVNIPLSHKC